MGAPLGGRTLLSASSMQAVAETVQSSENRTSAPRSPGSDVRSVVDTTSNETGIERCLPDSLFDPRGELVGGQTVN